MKRSLLSLLAAASLTFSASASHISGGELLWECLGGDSYEVTLILYRDCAGIDVSTTETVFANSPCDNFSFQVTAAPAVEVSQLCAQDIGNSTCNGGFLPGIEMYVYTAIVDLEACDTWTLSWSLCCRNNAIQNLTNPDLQDTYIEGTLNNALSPCDNSPQFTNEPIPYVCLGTTVSYSYGGFDVDGDSLSYQLISAMEAGGNPLAYVFPYTPNEPITGLTWDPVTGLVTFTLNQQGNWVVVMEITQWNTDVSPPEPIGTVMRDMQFVGYPCTNQPLDPNQGEISNFQGNGAVQTGPYSVELCESDGFCFEMTYLDPDAGDTLNAVSNVVQNLPGATFSYTGTNPITVTVCWEATPGTSGFFPFIVTVSDNACPIVGFNTFVYSVNVLERTSAGPDQTICGDQVAQLNAEGGTQFTWSVLSGDPIQVGVNFTCNPCENPIADPDNTTTYIVTSDLTGSCINGDTVTVFVVPDFTFQVTQSDTVVCLGEQVQFNTTLNPNQPGYTFEWTPDLYLSNPTLGNPVGTYIQPGTIEYLVEITSPDGCVKQDTTLQVIVTPGYNPDISVTQSDEFVCEGGTTQFQVTLDCTLPGFCGLYDGPCCGPLSVGDVGDGTNATPATGTFPPSVFGNFYKSGRVQMLYLASELQALGFAGGKINELGFDVTVIPATAADQYLNYSVKVGCTTLDEMTGQNYVQGLTEVFSADTLDVAPGWNMFALPVSFNWDGVSNLVVEVCFDMIALPGFTQNCPNTYTTTTFNSVQWDFDDFTNMCDNTGFITTSGDRPNIRLVYCGGVDLNDLEYSWSPTVGLDDATSANPNVTPPSSPITYTVTVGETGSGCESTADVTVGWYPPADVSFIPQPDEGVYPFAPYFNNTSASDVTSFVWNFGNGDGSTDQFPNYTFQGPGVYVVTLQGTSVNGCVGLFVDTVIVLDQPIVEIPNVFSPNGDGENDTFAFLDFRGFDTFSFKVFNRWGMLVHETRNVRDGNNTIWKPANDVPDGTYYYVFNGKGLNGDSFEKTGHITLVR